jgi:predicted unusual protein kinase regulating ubiquinone biosynthesis (AarF/ABC1/UbiB family)
MEYLPGTKITDFEQLDAKGIDRSDLAARLQESYLQMIIADGVFHADPHPGNLAVADDGALIFYDFGMSGTVASTIQQQIVEFYVAVANQDIEQILDTLVEMGTLSPTADRQVMGDVMELAIADARGEEIEQYRVNEIIAQVESTIYEFPLRLPRELALILRVATVVEGVCISLDADFDFISVATDYLSEEGYMQESVQRVARGAATQVQETSRALFEVPPKLNDILDEVNREKFTVNVRLEDENDVLDRLARRLTYGILLSVGVLSTALLYAFEDSPEAAGVAGVLTLPLAYLLYRSFKRRKGVKAKPQFTRQNLRQRRGED